MRFYLRHYDILCYEITTRHLRDIIRENLRFWSYGYGAKELRREEVQEFGDQRYWPLAAQLGIVAFCNGSLLPCIIGYWLTMALLAAAFG